MLELAPPDAPTMTGSPSGSGAVPDCAKQVRGRDDLALLPHLSVSG